MLRIIAIGGPHGSGKSSVAKRLAKELKMNYISAGDVFRTIAKERNLTLEEMSEQILLEPGIDLEIDERTKKLGAIDNTVVDAQLAVYFTPENIALRLCINASFETRCKRIAGREKKSIVDSRNETRVREESEFQRFKDLYSVDVNDHSVYDVIINNDRINEEETFQLTRSIAITSLG